jgi:hypothetical protein
MIDTIVVFLVSLVSWYLAVSFINPLPISPTKFVAFLGLYTALIFFLNLLGKSSGRIKLKYLGSNKLQRYIIYSNLLFAYSYLCFLDLKNQLHTMILIIPTAFLTLLFLYLKRTDEPIA